MSDTKTPAVHPLLEGTTSGPWRISTANPLAINSDQGEGSVGIATTYWGADGIFPLLPEAKANANLIAMAPILAAENARLRAALEEIIYQADEGMPISDIHQCIVVAREVLASLTT